MPFTLSSSGKPLRKPDIKKNRVAWNEAWEKDLAAQYALGDQMPSFYSIVKQSPNRYTADSYSTTLLNTMRIKQGVCELQHDFAVRMVESLTTDRFEERWRDLLDARRRELVLEGICRAVLAGGPEMEERRIWCPEITLNGLTQQRGSGYMELVKKLLPADVNSPISEPIFVAHPLINRVMKDDGTDRRVSTEIQQMRLSRTYFLSTVAWQTLLAFVSLI